MNKSGMEWTHLDLLLDFPHVLPSLLYLCIGQTKRACTFGGLDYSTMFLITEDLIQQPLEAHLTLSSKSSRSTSSKSNEVCSYSPRWTTCAEVSQYIAQSSSSRTSSRASFSSSVLA